MENNNTHIEAQDGVDQKEHDRVFMLEETIQKLDGEPLRKKAQRRNSNGSATSNSTISSKMNTNIWSRAIRKARQNKDWEYDMNCSEHSEDNAFAEKARDWWIHARNRMKKTKSTVRKHPTILIWSLLSFAAVLGTGVAAVCFFANEYEQDQYDHATSLALETGEQFSDQLERAILPLFSLAQFVFEIPELKNLPNLIGQVGSNGSLPLLPPKVEGNYPTHRNVTGVCDDEDLVSRFSGIASTIKTNAHMDGILVNLQLAPMATVCLLHPLNNTEDFPPGVFMDNTGAVGHDLLTDPARSFIAEATIPARRVVTAGPLTLRQCSDCDPTVEKAFIARLPIYMDDFSMDVDGQTYNAWGFAVALINWGELVQRTDIFDTFEMSRLGFELVRRDQKYDPDTDSYYEQVAVLAEVRGDELTESNSVVIKLDTTDNEWEMRVGYPQGARPSWFGGAIVSVVGFSILVFILMFLVLLNKAAYYDILLDMFPKKALKKLNKNETVIEQYMVATVFFSDIVGYTTISSEMNPGDLMKILNELYAEMDRLTDEYGVYKLETVGDAYMVVGGCPDRCSGSEGAQKVALFALAVIDMVKYFETSSGMSLTLRAGLNSGPLVAGVVGTKKPHYTVFGDTVNVASRMESSSEEMKIQVSKSTHKLLNKAPGYDFDMASRGERSVKGKGSMHTWFLNEKRERSEPREIVERPLLEQPEDTNV